jgi:predicted phage replisome organizer
MVERKCVKLKVNMYEDTKFKIIDMKPERDLIHYIWTRFITLAGKVNLEGKLYMSKNIPYTMETLAIEFNRGSYQVKLALEVFMELEMIECTEDNVYIVKNFAKHQNIKVKDAIKPKNNGSDKVNDKDCTDGKDEVKGEDDIKVKKTEVGENLKNELYNNEDKESEGRVSAIYDNKAEKSKDKVSAGHDNKVGKSNNKTSKNKISKNKTSKDKVDNAKDNEYGKLESELLST